MAKMKEVTYLVIDIEDRPGALAEFMRILKNAKIGLKGIWAFALRPNGIGKIFALPQNAEKLKKACQSHGYRFEQNVAFSISGPDKTGALCETLDQFAKAGISLDAVDAIAVGGKFAGYIWADPAAAKKVI